MGGAFPGNRRTPQQAYTPSPSQFNSQGQATAHFISYGGGNALVLQQGGISQPQVGQKKPLYVQGTYVVCMYFIRRRFHRRCCYTNTSDSHSFFFPIIFFDSFFSFPSYITTRCRTGSNHSCAGPGWSSERNYNPRWIWTRLFLHCRIRRTILQDRIILRPTTTNGCSTKDVPNRRRHTRRQQWLRRWFCFWISQPFLCSHTFSSCCCFIPWGRNWS